MAVETQLSVEEYLNTSYDPDVEYVDGVLVERNVGDFIHSLVQSNLIFAIRLKYPRVFVLPEFRSKTADTRYRLPDVCVLLARPNTRYLLEAAYLVIEILSESDSMSMIVEKLEEYTCKGVPNIWLIDPRLKRIWIYSSGDLHEVSGDIVSTIDNELQLTRGEIFQDA
jgi:Uma2 family endonuclease